MTNNTWHRLGNKSQWISKRLAPYQLKKVNPQQRSNIVLDLARSKMNKSKAQRHNLRQREHQVTQDPKTP